MHEAFVSGKFPLGKFLGPVLFCTSRSVALLFATHGCYLWDTAEGMLSILVALSFFVSDFSFSELLVSSVFLLALF